MSQTIDNIIYSDDLKTVEGVENKEITSAVIKEVVTTIGNSAFNGCENLQSVVIPSSVTTIGIEAFYHCENLQEVKYLGTAKEWGKVKFAKSEEKAEIRKLIKEFALKDAKDAKIKEIQTVSVEGFMNAMKEIYPSFNFQILNSTKTNQALFIMGGKNATVIQVSSNISSWMENFKSFLSVFCDETKTNEEIEEAFTTYKIKIAEIKKTFQKPQIEVDEMNLFIDELPELKKEDEYGIDSVSFFYKAKIKKLTFARNTSIDWCTFEYNESLESIILPSSVTTIGESAFNWCTNLQNIVIPEGVTTIGGSAFSCCAKLQSIVIPEGVTAIGERAFFDCINLHSVVIPDSVLEIGEDVFKHCNIENHDHKLLKIKNGCCFSSDEKTVLYCSNYFKQEIVIPECVTEIGDQAFVLCLNLQNIEIPSSVTAIGRGAFEDCSHLTVTFDGTKEEWEKIEGVKDCGTNNVKFNK